MPGRAKSRKVARFGEAGGDQSRWHAGCAVLTASMSALFRKLLEQPRWILAAGAAGTLGVLLIVGLITTTAVDLARFQRTDARRSTIVYAAPLELRPGVQVPSVDLAGALARLAYRETTTPPTAPGEYRRTRDGWDLFLRTAAGGSSRRLRVDVQGDRIARVTEDGTSVGSALLEPEPLTSAGAVPGEANRPMRLSEVPTVVRSAVLTAEDERFFEHGGLDLRAMARALWANTRAGRVVEGGSTITQQLVKNRVLSPERTVWRKLREIWVATAVEWRYPKEEIFEAYLNEVYLGHAWGSPVRGVGAASRAYFDKELHQVTLSEAALLAGMIRAPNTYSPMVNPARARARRDVVLAQMQERGKITSADYQRARRQLVRVPSRGDTGSLAPYFIDHVRQEVDRLTGSHGSAGEAGQVFTTLDVPLQRFAEAAVARGLDRLETRRPHLRRREAADRLQAALIALDPATGRIRALVGGRSYGASQFNRATLARRQPGSAFKPFVYLAALRAAGGQFTAASIVDDAPITIGGTIAGQRASWTPRNYRDRYEGRVTLRRALEQSLNGATVRVAQSVGWPAVADTARALGIESELKPVPALALGAFEVTPLELARAYLPLANEGQRVTPTAVERLTNGTARPRATPEGQRVLSPAEAYLMTSLLEGVINTGTGAEARAFGVPGRVAGKTGTTNEGRDAWFVGYSSNLLVLVWVGFDDSTAHGLSGAEAALPIWADFMKQALTTYPAAAFVVPPGVATVSIDPTNGKRAGAYCPLVTSEVFLIGTEPPPCTEHGLVDKLQGLWNRLWSSASDAPESAEQGQVSRHYSDGSLVPPPTQSPPPPSNVARSLQPSGDWAPSSPRSQN
jgi:penicillin-binding protein 1B